MALSDVILTRRGGSNPIRLSAAAARASWVINEAGSFSCDLVTSEIIAAGLSLQLESMWLEWQHPTGGTWGGKITAAGESSDGIYKVTAAGYAALLERRFVRLTESGSPGSLFRRAFTEVSGKGSTFLTLGSIDESGPDLSPDEGREQFYESLIPRLCDEGGREWRVNPDRTITFAPRLGADKTASVRLAQGLHIASYATTGDETLIENVLYGVATYFWQRKGKRRERQATGEESNQASIDRYGRFEGERDFGTIKDEGTIKTLLREELARTAFPSRTVNVTLTEIAGEWADFREGDTVRVAIGSAAVEYDLRIMSRAIDVDQGVMEVAGEATNAS